ncbi:MAG: hypothetical protein CSA26_01570 [Desulfobacterales bacterium]|nr:MAG: hypothetical protein CSA26_01570 [Desulfobacterales bacterium]
MSDNAQRIEKGVSRGKRFEIIVNDKRIEAYEGETIGAALMAAGVYGLRTSRNKKEPRGIFCGIGICQECRVTVNGVANVQACETLATPECRVEI